MKQKSPAEILKMSQEELHKYNAEKIIAIFDAIIINCERFKKEFKQSAEYSKKRTHLMAISLAFSNLLSDDRVEAELIKIQNEAELLNQKLKHGTH